MADTKDKVMLLREREVAQLLRISVTRIQHMRLEGSGPPFVRIGRSVRYPTADLAEWCNSLKRLGDPSQVNGRDAADRAR